MLTGYYKVCSTGFLCLMLFGRLQGTRVALKKIPSRSVSLTKKLLRDLKGMKDLSHDHLVRCNASPG
jgi:hypothetical protein